MAECSFKPKISAPPTQQEHVKVNGLERFLELKDLKRRQDQ
jgi:hypothetical protein